MIELHDLRVVREILQDTFGVAVDAAFVTKDRSQVFAYVHDLTDAILDGVFEAEHDLSRRLCQPTELRLVAHQGRAYPSEQVGADRAI